MQKDGNKWIVYFSPGYSKSYGFSLQKYTLCDVRIQCPKQK